MRLNFKKVSAIAASALMVGMTMGVAAAANYPQPFVAGGAANVAIVYGTGSGVSTLDVIQAGNIQTNLQSYMSGTSGSTTATGGAFWQVGTSSNDLELGESINDIETYIGSSELSLLSDGVISNEKGDADYTQNLYFDNALDEYVIYTEDDDDNIGLFFKITSGQEIARYVMDFTTALKSDIETTGHLSDIEDKDITFLGKTYTIVEALNGTSTAGASLTLMSGASKGTVVEGTPLTVDSYTVSVQVTSATAAQFTITSASGTETTDKMNKGDMEKLSNGKYLAVTDISYEGYADGNQQATFYIGADKLEWTNESSMVVNGETISDAKVAITKTESGGDISISEISINMTAEDDLYVPVNGKLSQATNLDEPQVLVSENWDIEFKGLEAIDYEDISMKVSESDQQYTLRWANYNGDAMELPLVYANQTGVFGGDDADKRLVLNPNGTLVDTASQNITKKDYFFLNTANPRDPTSNAKTILVQYMDADKVTDTNPKVTLRVNGVDQEVSLAVEGTFTLKAAGGTFNFVNDTVGTTNDFSISLRGDDYASGATNNSVSAYIRTEFNTLINVTDLNASDATSTETQGDLQSWSVNVSVDDGNRDGDHTPVGINAGAQVFEMTISNSSATPWDATSAVTKGATWQTDNSDNTVERYIGNYGYEIVSTTPSSSPTSIEAKVPKNIVKPLVYVSSGDLQVTTTAGGATSLGEVLVTDSEVSSVSSKNLIVVGGSCINSVAANLLGSACGSDFTDKTGIGSGQFLIQSLTSTYSSGKIALVVAGYEAADTVNAATYLRTQTVDTTAGKKYKGTSATNAELVTTTA